MTDPRRAFISGITGQMGAALTERLLAEGWEVHGLVRRSSAINTPRIDHLYRDPHESGVRLLLHYGDLCDAGSIRRALAKARPEVVYNAAAQSVPEDEFLPLMLCNSISVRSFGELWAELRNKSSPKRVVVKGIETEVIEVRSPQIRALGWSGGFGHWLPIKQISRHRYKGELSVMRQRWGEVQCTPNHCLLDDMNRPCSPADNRELLRIRSINYDQQRTIDSVRLTVRGKWKSDGKWNWCIGRNKTEAVIKQVSGKRLDSLIAFIGAFVAEGHTSYNKNNNSYVVGISNSDSSWLRELQDNLSMFCKAKSWLIEHKKAGYASVWELQTRSKYLYRLLRIWCGEESSKKRLPDWMFQVNRRRKRLVFDNMVRGDGRKIHRNQSQYTTISRRLACQVGLLMTMIGLQYTVYSSGPQKKKRWAPCYCLRETLQYNAAGNRNRRHDSSDYDGWVYDISLPQCENFAVGVGNIVVHNSHVMVSFIVPDYTQDVVGAGAQRVLEAVADVCPKARVVQFSSSEMFGTSPAPQDESTPLVPVSPYARAKVFAHHAAIGARSEYGLDTRCAILFNTECLVGETPVVIRDECGIDVVPMEDLVPHRTKKRHGTRYHVRPARPLKVWSGSEWTDVLGMHATWHDEEINQIHVRCGNVSGTKTHVGFMDDLSEREFGKMNVGERIRTCRAPDPTNAVEMTEDEAWLLGIIASDGYVDSKTRCARITNTDEAILDRARKCWMSITGCGTKTAFGSSGFKPGNVIPRIELLGSRPYLRMLRDELYTVRSNMKRVPRRVLNGSDKVRLSFLRGFNAGDGLKAGNGIDEFKSFGSSSPVLAHGLCILASWMGRRISVYRQKKELGKDVYVLNLSSGGSYGKKGNHLRKDSQEIRKIKTARYGGWMFDLTTTVGRYSAGVGFIVVHNSEMRGETFVSRKVTLAAARIAAGLQERLYLGNPDAIRDWQHVSDTVDALVRIAAHPTAGEWVIGRGDEHSVHELVETAFGRLNLDWRRHVVYGDPRYLRPSEVPRLRANAARARAELDWEPKIGFAELVARMVDHDVSLARVQAFARDERARAGGSVAR